jgi:hypothetical protein
MSEFAIAMRLSPVAGDIPGAAEVGNAAAFSILPRVRGRII